MDRCPSRPAVVPACLAGRLIRNSRRWLTPHHGPTAVIVVPNKRAHATVVIPTRSAIPYTSLRDPPGEFGVALQAASKGDLPAADGIARPGLSGDVLCGTTAATGRLNPVRALHRPRWSLGSIGGPKGNARSTVDGHKGRTRSVIVPVPIDSIEEGQVNPLRRCFHHTLMEIHAPNHAAARRAR
jgi:hypothetical protein